MITRACLPSPLLAVGIHLVFLGYLYATIRSINRFGVNIRQIFSNIENKQLSWLRSLLIGYSIVWTVSMFYCLSAHVYKSGDSTAWVVAIGAVTGFIFINYLFVNALRQPIIFSGLSRRVGSWQSITKAMRFPFLTTGLSTLWINICRRQNPISTRTSPWNNWPRNWRCNRANSPELSTRV